MADNQLNSVCNYLKNEWRSIVTLINYLSTLLDKIKAEINSLLHRIQNTIIARMLSTIRDIRDIISNYLGLQIIDNNALRKNFCETLYQCEAYVKALDKLMPTELYNKFFNNDVQFVDLSKYGFYGPTHFESSFALFEYVACRLSLRSILDGVTNQIINNLMNFLEKFDKYFDLNWWLQNTVWGRCLQRLINEYDLVFQRIKPYIQKLNEFLNCTFALCDFTASVNNLFTDLQTRYAIKRDTTMPNEFVILKEDLYQDLAISMNAAKNEIKTFKRTLVAPLTQTPPNFHTRTTGESIPSENIQSRQANDSQTTPFNTTELSTIKNNVTNRKSSLTPGVTDGSPVNLRRVQVFYSPNTDPSQV